ncbi:hypothetical protein B0H17DRAFT_1192310 [Mycena rosella]|uniref:Uncharacterized protein n=1 Tax=Mycena rosella TaxID=1033263 RepID=A0AAD7GWC4_MYCRO|nr:hypothetical protein B0H17DRAFT_1192310 [Mycena rosella]
MSEAADPSVLAKCSFVRIIIILEAAPFPPPLASLTGGDLVQTGVEDYRTDCGIAGVTQDLHDAYIDPMSSGMPDNRYPSTVKILPLILPSVLLTIIIAWWDIVQNAELCRYMLSSPDEGLGAEKVVLADGKALEETVFGKRPE